MPDREAPCIICLDPNTVLGYRVCFKCMRIFETLGISRDDVRRIEEGVERLEVLRNPSIKLGED